LFQNGIDEAERQPLLAAPHEITHRGGNNFVLPQRLDELDPARPTVCVCHHGVRSSHAAFFLAERGFELLYNLSGGVDRWATEVDASMRRY